MKIFELIRIVGGIAICLLIVTIALSVFRRFSPRIMLRLHKISGIATLGTALCHVIMVMVWMG
ncbi:MAG: hypothetical protein HZA50_09730 [Planctomycetes bacterium]|nr:hypothetical protein [Planctomycetota bacterium]